MYSIVGVHPFFFYYVWVVLTFLFEDNHNNTS